MWRIRRANHEETESAHFLPAETGSNTPIASGASSVPMAFKPLNSGQNSAALAFTPTGSNARQGIIERHNPIVGINVYFIPLFGFLLLNYYLLSILLHLIPPFSTNWVLNIFMTKGR